MHKFWEVNVMAEGEALSCGHTVIQCPTCMKKTLSELLFSFSTNTMSRSTENILRERDEFPFGKAPFPPCLWIIQRKLLSRSGSESEMLREIQQMGVLAACPLTFTLSHPDERIRWWFMQDSSRNRSVKMSRKGKSRNVIQRDFMVWALCV